MKQFKSIYAMIALLIVFLLYNIIFVVNEKEKAVIVQLGEAVKVIDKPGLYFKMPFIQSPIFFDSRILTYDTRPAEALTSDKKTIVLDNYACWKIEDPLLFYQTLRTRMNAQARLDDVIYSQLRIAVGSHTLTEIVTASRTEIMDAVTKKAATALKDFGVAIVDVRIKKADLPTENQVAIFERMRSERQRQARQYRSEGEEEAIRIRSTTDKEQSIILANARGTSTVLEGEAEAEVAKIYAVAYSKDPSLFSFIRSMNAYKNSFNENTSMVLTPESPFLRFFK